MQGGRTERIWEGERGGGVGGTKLFYIDSSYRKTCAGVFDDSVNDDVTPPMLCAVRELSDRLVESLCGVFAAYPSLEVYQNEAHD